MTRPYWAAKPNETDLRIELVWGGTICLRGADNYDSLRRQREPSKQFIKGDEIQTVAGARCFARRSPTNEDGRCSSARRKVTTTSSSFSRTRNSSPSGQLINTRRSRAATSHGRSWKARPHEMGARVFRQEFQARFENMGVGRAYYVFERGHHVRRLRYDPAVPLFWALDFNVNPLCSIICQIVNGRVHVLDELVLPDSNTLAAGEEFLERTRKWTIAPEFPAPPADAGEQAEEFLDDLYASATASTVERVCLWRCHGYSNENVSVAYRLAKVTSRRSSGSPIRSSSRHATGGS
jgi:hypothetical protein